MFPPGIEPGTICVLGRCDNHYTTETQILLRPNLYYMFVNKISFKFDVFVFRRMRDTIATTGRGQFSRVIIAGLSNVYTHYITTYQVLTIKRLYPLHHHLPGSYP